MPIRIQRKRTKGWKMPENTISVTRPGKWGNPFQVDCKIPDELAQLLDKDEYFYFMKLNYGYIEKAEEAVSLFKKYIAPKLNTEELKGKNLACFCKEGEACHADVLLEFANH